MHVVLTMRACNASPHVGPDPGLPTAELTVRHSRHQACHSGAAKLGFCDILPRGRPFRRVNLCGVWQRSGREFVASVTLSGNSLCDTRLRVHRSG